MREEDPPKSDLTKSDLGSAAMRDGEGIYGLVFRASSEVVTALVTARCPRWPTITRANHHAIMRT